MTQQPTPIRSLADDAATYLDLTERINDLTEQRNGIAARLAAAGPGKHDVGGGVHVTVTAPSRRFNLDRALNLLTDGQKAVCMTYDAKKVKDQLPGVLLDQCMDAGTGSPRVSVK